MTPEEVPEELMLAAMQAVYEQLKADVPSNSYLWLETARHAIAAVLPLHEQQVRQAAAANGARADLAPHGGFTIHAREGGYGLHGGLAVYVTCECGRGYSWERKIPSAELVAWLSSHGPDIPLDEEERRVAEAGGREPKEPAL